MRILLATAVAIAPLMAAAGVQAQTTPTPETVISTARTTPISTSTATGTAPDNIRFANGGSIAVTTGAAVTVDSNNGVDMDSGSSITMAKAADGATGILARGGTTGPITIGGTISISDDIEEYKDTDKDGDPDGPFASGTDRYGVRVTGPGAKTGNILVETSGAILVEGNNSYGMSIEAPLVGNLTTFGNVTVTGDNTHGISVTGPVTGNVDILGNVTARGQNAVGVAIEGPVDGRLNIQGTVTSTGYRYTTRPGNKPTSGTVPAEVLFLENLDADDLLQGGPAVLIGGDASQGVVFGAAPSYGSAGIEGDDDGDGVKNGDEDDDGDGVKNREDPDRDGDGLPDANETTAKITSYGAAPGVLVGSTDNSVTLGVAGTGANAYGFVNRGEIFGIGVYDDVASTALQFGVAGGQAVTIEGGVRNDGSIAVLANNADATAVRFAAGATTPTMVNNGTISAASATDAADQVTAVRIEAGANVASFTNDGVIAATAGGGKANTTAIADLSGSLTSITNTRSIQANVSANAAGDAITGKATAIDVSANTSGVTFTQKGIASTPTTADPDTDGDGVTDSREPSTFGDIKLGSGADVLDIQNGVVQGNIDFGAGADRLSITGGAVVRGAITNADGLLDINVSKGTLDARQSGVTTISNLNLGADGDLIVTIDPAAGGNSGFKVDGVANIANGAGLGVRFNSLLQDPTRFTIIDANTLNVGALDTVAVQANSPYAFVVKAGADVTAGEVYIDARRRTADEAGMIAVEASAYDSIYAALDKNEAIRNAVLSQTGRDGFFDLYEQMLPDHSGGPLLSLASGVDAVNRALTGRNASAAPGETSAWVQEINFYADKDKTDSYGFRSEGFGVAGGVERGTSMGAVGITAAFTSSDLQDPEAAAEEVLSANLLELGLYWRAQGQYWTTWARAAGGYASFNATRKLVADGLNLKNESDWHGFTLAAAGGASYERHFGRVNIRPEIYGEYFSLNEEARSEKGGGDGFDLDIDERDSHIFSGVAAVNIGYGFGKDGWIRPEIRAGWRQNFSVDAGSTIARFASGGDAFTLDPASIEGGGPILGFRLNVGNDLGMLSITGDAELLEDYVRYTLLLRASFKF
ncbi:MULTISPECIES: autotransporter outer membrane beta-barrel domain-containing protein [unclassified Brevundimonas]|uniref:autotransporter outer membrane beta-barrel domain-containing protein n=1 Tax=unclassified Brevundimonas TaxID=2622653 RepID=UPI0025B91451|nr:MULTISPECIES: autotransporter outer membrane beta-barrel domain-containing protein [unclassified Brevundimonas]